MNDRCTMTGGFTFFGWSGVETINQLKTAVSTITKFKYYRRQRVLGAPKSAIRKNAKMQSVPGEALKVHLQITKFASRPLSAAVCRCTRVTHNAHNRHSQQSNKNKDRYTHPAHGKLATHPGHRAAQEGKSALRKTLKFAFGPKSAT